MCVISVCTLSQSTDYTGPVRASRTLHVSHMCPVCGALVLATVTCSFRKTNTHSYSTRVARPAPSWPEPRPHSGTRRHPLLIPRGRSELWPVSLQPIDRSVEQLLVDKALAEAGCAPRVMMFCACNGGASSGSDRGPVEWRHTPWSRRAAHASPLRSALGPAQPAAWLPRGMRSAHATEVRAPVAVFTAALGFPWHACGRTWCLSAPQTSPR